MEYYYLIQSGLEQLGFAAGYFVGVLATVMFAWGLRILDI